MALEDVHNFLMEAQHITQEAQFVVESLPNGEQPAVKRVTHQLSAISSILSTLNNPLSDMASAIDPIDYVEGLIRALDDFLTNPPLHPSTHIPRTAAGRPGRPAYAVNLIRALRLHDLGNTWEDISKAMGVFGETIYYYQMEREGRSTALAMISFMTASLTHRNPPSPFKRPVPAVSVPFLRRASPAPLAIDLRCRDPNSKVTDWMPPESGQPTLPSSPRFSVTGSLAPGDVPVRGLCRYLQTFLTQAVDLHALEEILVPGNISYDLADHPTSGASPINSFIDLASIALESPIGPSSRDRSVPREILPANSPQLTASRRQIRINSGTMASSFQRIHRLARTELCLTPRRIVPAFHPPPDLAPPPPSSPPPARLASSVTASDRRKSWCAIETRSLLISSVPPTFRWPHYATSSLESSWPFDGLPSIPILFVSEFEPSLRAPLAAPHPPNRGLCPFSSFARPCSLSWALHQQTRALEARNLSRTPQPIHAACLSLPQRYFPVADAIAPAPLNCVSQNADGSIEDDESEWTDVAA
ncbi:hypothetical protein DFH09DRAFT_1364727 [Mycena vulgaris]|nr:hypothetical protein DFH09DRAFT_1364727 [Mycena vulgaris]